MPNKTRNSTESLRQRVKAVIVKYPFPTSAGAALQLSLVCPNPWQLVHYPSFQWDVWTVN